MRRFEIKETSCPHCGAWLNSVRNDENVLPDPGDLSVCVACFNVSVFDEAFRLRLPTSEEAAEYRSEPNLRAAISRTTAAILERKKGTSNE